MTFFTDDRLRQAAQEAGAILDGSLPAPEDCPHTFSLPFQAKMAKLLRRHKRAPARRAMRRVACLVLVCLLGSGVFLTTNAQAREAFFGWIREQVEGAQRYFHTGKATLPEEIVHYQITVPEEYTLVSGLTSDTFVNQGYESPSGGYISFSYQYETENSSGNLYVMDTEAQRTQVEIHGSPADLYLSDDPESSNTIIWMDQKTGALIEVTAFLGADDLLSLAETVTEGSSEIAPAQIAVPPEYVWYNDLYDHGLIQQTYMPPDGQWIEFIYRAELSGEETLLPSSGAKKQDVTIQGIPATLYLSYPEPGRDTLLWTDPETGALVYLSAGTENLDLVSLAEGILPLPDWLEQPYRS